MSIYDTKHLYVPLKSTRRHNNLQWQFIIKNMQEASEMIEVVTHTRVPRVWGLRTAPRPHFCEEQLLTSIQDNIERLNPPPGGGGQ
jgi:hypothetical protein